MKKNNREFYLSLAAHSLLCAALIFSIYKKADLKTAPQPSLLAYSINETSASSSSQNSITKQSMPTNQSNISHHLKPRTAKSKITQTTLKKNLIEGGEGDEQKILSLLHSSIAKNQSYPESALALKQAGTVKVSFQLHPDGILTNVYVTKTSGVSAIDEAALAAVQASSPVKNIGGLLNGMKVFSVDVVFEM